VTSVLEPLGHDPVTSMLILGSAVWYAAGVRALWARAGRGRGVHRWQVWSFALGTCALAVALLSPLADLAEVLLSAHMTQHELLMLVAAPLLVFAHPLFVGLWALPQAWREQIGHVTRRPGVASTWHTLSSPLMVFVLHGLALWIWHAPVLYEAALESEAVHAAQHFCFFLTAALFWWGMVGGRYGKAAYGVSVLYVFLTAVHSAGLGALLTIAPSLWYPDYAASAAERHVDPLADQQLAGLLMWIPFGVILILLGLALFSAWLGESERRVRVTALGGGPAIKPSRGPE
jgi:putative membrane protein